MFWLQFLILWFMVGVIFAILFGIVCQGLRRDPDQTDPALDDRRSRDHGGRH